MYHRYKFPICLRYADFDLMPTIFRTMPYFERHILVEATLTLFPKMWIGKLTEEEKV